MLFNSFEFVVFFALVLAVCGALGRRFAARKTLLLVASWAFYATWSPRFLPLLVATTAVDFQLARWIYARRWAAPGDEHPDGRRRARPLLVASLLANLGLLGLFKYGAFLYQSAAVVVPLGPLPDVLRVVAPLGISFYTFHSISYVIDTYRGLRPPTDDFRDFALYVAFFPQLVAGPITRWGFFGPQLATPRTVRFADVETALFLLAVGCVKKVLCADTLGGFVDQVYAMPYNVGQLQHWLALYAYAFQIYFDFSGYTDIAWGLAGLLGFRLPENFRHPYLSTSPREFWQRWHVSLSTWLRDYLYVSLGGSRRGRVRTYLNLFATMLLGGLWHGAAWTFVLWGAYHGAWLALHRWWTERGGVPRTATWNRRLVTFHLVALGWVLFRARSLPATLDMLERLFRPAPMVGPFPIATFAIVLLGVLTHALTLRDHIDWWQRLPRPVQGVAYGTLIVLVGLLSTQSGRFIYFQF